MAKGYLSNRQKNLRIGISSYTENKTVLEVTGKVGVGTFDARSSLDIIADVNNLNWLKDNGCSFDITYGCWGVKLINFNMNDYDFLFEKYPEHTLILLHTKHKNTVKLEKQK